MAIVSIAPFLFGTVNEPIRWLLFSGYRSDRLHWHVQNDGSGVNYREIYPSLSFWENGLSIETIYRDIVFSVRGSYAAFGSGTLKQRYSALSFTSDTLSFSFPTDGWAADVSGLLGYTANLTAGRHYQVAVAPLLGYGGYFERLKRGGSSSSAGTLIPSLGGGEFTFTSSLPGPLEQTWYGLGLGAGLFIRPNERSSLQVGYLYNWLHLDFQNQTEQVLANVPSLPASSTETLQAKESGNLGQTGWARAEVVVAPHWRIGLGGQIRYFSSEVLNASIKGSGGGRTEKFKARWTQVGGWATVSREF